jgi:hypothetical protein
LRRQVKCLAVVAAPSQVVREPVVEPLDGDEIAAFVNHCDAPPGAFLLFASVTAAAMTFFAPSKVKAFLSTVWASADDTQANAIAMIRSFVGFMGFSSCTSEMIWRLDATDAERDARGIRPAKLRSNSIAGSKIHSCSRAATQLLDNAERG